MQIFGVTAINVPDLLQALRKQGDVVTIGTETGVLESKRLINHIAEHVVVHCKPLLVCVCMQDRHSLLPQYL